MPSITKARLAQLEACEREHNPRAEAQLEALRAENDGLRLQVAGEQLRCAELEAELSRLHTVHRDAVLIKNRAELMAVMRELSKQGVPCFMRGGFIYHSQTRAILAQIGV
jgi:hypothetical protein